MSGGCELCEEIERGVEVILVCDRLIFFSDLSVVTCAVVGYIRFVSRIATLQFDTYLKY